MTYVLDASPAHGALGNLDADNGTVSYTARRLFTGTDTFTYHAVDSNGIAATQTVTVTVVQSSPVLSHVRVSNARFRVGSRPTAISGAVRRAARAPLGTQFLFTVSLPATVQIGLVQKASGVRRGGVCVAPAPGLRGAGGGQCTRTIGRGSLVRSTEPAGSDAISFSGRVGSRALPPGSYQATVQAANDSGRSMAITVKFTIVT